jgi:hypothetical protein
MPGGSELNADLEAAVARGPLRAWADRAAQELTLDAQREAPPARVWKTVGDERVRATHEKADGQAIPSNLKFILDKPEAGPTVHGQASRAAHHAEGHHGGSSGNIARKASALGIELARYPRDETLSPGNRCNCRCSAPVVTGLVAASVHPDPVVVTGTQARIVVSTSFNRAAESEFGDGDSPGLRWMGRALNGFASRIAARGK